MENAKEKIHAAQEVMKEQQELIEKLVKESENVSGGSEEILAHVLENMVVDFLVSPKRCGNWR